ncbi:hypothetical protein CMU51_04445 [Elizabethkingia anophelis]|uniref:Uncharacterized protein n=1 Tax=Elizabethkingia anophelis TaxID=1117645 RepID=A0AAE4NZP1_9FLAO|nr:hypothetical protein [Elizabethkingia anophelis]
MFILEGISFFIHTLYMPLHDLKTFFFYCKHYLERFVHKSPDAFFLALISSLQITEKEKSGTKPDFV